MNATITFPKREQAERFATAWARKTKTGHIVGSGMENVEVTVFDITEESKVFIDTFIESLNNEIINEQN